MKKRIAFLLIVPLLCVLAASLNISYMPAGGLLFISTCTLMVNRSLSGRKPCLTVRKSPCTTAKPPSYTPNTAV